MTTSAGTPAAPNRLNVERCHAALPRCSVLNLIVPAPLPLPDSNAPLSSTDTGLITDPLPPSDPPAFTVTGLAVNEPLMNNLPEVICVGPEKSFAPLRMTD